jgi:large subunit ribosomal protein L18e
MTKKEISKSKIENRIRKKMNPYLISTAIALKKTNPEIAKILVMPKRKMVRINLEELDAQLKDSDKALIPGKVLGTGNLTKKVKIIAYSFSESAVEKLEKAKIEFSELSEEIKTNKKLNEYKIIR